MTDRTCPACNSPLRDKRPDAVYCSELCRKRAETRRRHHRAGYEATFDLTLCRITDNVASVDMGRYWDALRADPCAYCGEACAELDHILARSRGGMNDWLNLTASCEPCNRQKKSRTLIGYLYAKPQLALLAETQALVDASLHIGPATIPLGQRAAKRPRSRRRAA